MDEISIVSKEDIEIELFDVVIVGAGISGLTAAFRLFQLRPSLAIKILEAKDRVGGRIYTADLPAANNSIDLWDLGGSWIGNKNIQPYINQLIVELNLKTYPQSFVGNKILQTGKKHEISSYDSTIPDIGLASLFDGANLLKSLESMQRRVSASHKPLDPNLLTYDSMTAETLFIKKTWTTCILECIKAGLRAAFGSELNKLSALYLFAFANSCGGFHNLIESGEAMAHGYKIEGGASRILLTILEIIGTDTIDIQTAVTSIEKKEEYSLIRTASGTQYKARHVIIAVPPHLTLNIQFNPPLNPTKIEYFSSVIPGHLIKIILTYETRFWLNDGFSGEVVTNGGPSVTDGCSSGPLCVVFDATTENHSPALVCFIGGEQAIQYESKTKTERKEAVLKSLEQFFNPSNVRDFIVYCEKIWRHESFVGGCPVVIAPPGVGKYINQNLTDPENQLYFAGSELGRTWSGFMEGAVESGERAALQILSKY